jgi:hypothetical protein
MEYNRIVAVTGMPGLYEVLSSKSDGAIVRSLADGSTKFISSRVHNLSHLESIEIYTVRDNVRLADVLGAMKESNEALPDVKDNKALKGYFEKVYADMDFERVYTSDMKKMVQWYQILNEQNIDFTAVTETETESVDGESTEAVTVEEPVAEVNEPVTEEAAPEAKPKRSREKKTEE